MCVCGESSASDYLQVLCGVQYQSIIKHNKAQQQLQVQHSVVYTQVAEAERDRAIERKKKTASMSLPLMGLPFKPVLPSYNEQRMQGWEGRESGRVGLWLSAGCRRNEPSPCPWTLQLQPLTCPTYFCLTLLHLFFFYWTHRLILFSTISFRGWVIDKVFHKCVFMELWLYNLYFNVI